MESGSSMATVTPPAEQDYSSQNSLLTDTASPSSPEQDDTNGDAHHHDHHQNGHSPEEQEEEVMSSPGELDWDSKKAGLVQQLISQTLLLSGQRCAPLPLLKGAPGMGTTRDGHHHHRLAPGGGTLSPLESSLWPQILLPTLTNSPTTATTTASATVTAVSSYAPEMMQGSSAPQGEWTVVEVETHH